ncbi:Fe(3+)-hydroxamate ABC transporter permease FhuB [Mannheimia haemolytica]|uniref:Fe(3+)-hydroxamate ABC transporter permease FhuB n=1 Tax=Mannheimia haemolytica TaxID=75985 RepID=UPI0001BCF665|nr:Fe(3+)-hydroxamate ABC transporter permease FhuB [Mannheimia haemolytica]EEY11432.1 ferrichrome transport permease protein [Mannheimia haemolytica serotype A2 str. BOVINE]MDW0617908.1 Fe(3+)-hydroxamate ABC transporter permease FhuB [Mannheimia haemolytica]MDW0722150.1 Fe(3+)-hydroxamate ABC transporter permease FhuB [Mannheimia haemolytica]MDW0735144.1 Fe(3+)-hydroxamate ABC transporter permease FhuB [Mannheimia haemolytica]TRC11542.1 Fe(3+)-hydroxamate ABC transporter permease FhuB [Mannh
MKSSFLLIGCILLSLVTAVIRLNMVWEWEWQLLLINVDLLPINQAAVKAALLPEMTTSFLAGGLLAIASSGLQHIVRNNLASDSTLAVSSGAQLALMIAVIFFPAAELFSSFWIALLGSLAAIVLVLFIAKASKLNPLTLILGGLIVNILFGAIASLLTLFYFDFLFGVMVWGSGSLLQDGWATSITLAITVVVAFFIFVLLSRPLTILSLDDEQARRLGAPVNLLRYLVIFVCAAITALVVSKIGVIGFIGFAGASLAHFAKIRHLLLRLLIAFLAGGFLLFFTNNLIGIVSRIYDTLLPVGAFTATLGAPLLIFLVLRQRKAQFEASNTAYFPVKRLNSWKLPILLLCAGVILFCLLQIIAPTMNGWAISIDENLMSSYRLPRSLSAIATGAMLAVSGSLLQILTRNPMASPEVLGVSSGATIAAILSFLLFPTLSSIGFLLFGVLGSLTVLALIMWLSRKLQPSALMITGVAIGALVSGLMAIIQLSGSPRLTAVISWLSGSTYYANPNTVWILLSVAILLISATLLFIKPLRLISLGETVSYHLGLEVKKVQMIVLLLIALMSAASTLAVGPMSFIGLMTPHLAKNLGAITPEKQIPISALLGAMLMLIADWLGRYLIFPYEIGAGIIASILGGIYFLLLLKQHK